MKKLITLFAAIAILASCKQGKSDIILPHSVGKTNQLLVVMKGADWDGKPGDEIRIVFGEHQIGLPQPETLLSVSQVDPSGFATFMRNNKSILIVQKSDKEKMTVVENKYASPQTIIYLSAKDEEGLVNQIATRGKEIIEIFNDQDIKVLQKYFRKKNLDVAKFETIKNLNISLTVPESYRLVDDTGDFLWLRQHLKSGIARGDGSNNILIYSVPLDDVATVADNITAVRDTIGKKYIPGSKEGMYMITEKAYTPFTFSAIIDKKQAYETRGKWEVKDNFMAGPFLNYTIIDKENNRLVIFEGFTYAPSVNKRDFIFELEAIGKSLKIN